MGALNETEATELPVFLIVMIFNTIDDVFKAIVHRSPTNIK